MLASNLAAVARGLDRRLPIFNVPVGLIGRLTADDERRNSREALRVDLIKGSTAAAGEGFENAARRKRSNC